ncbi:BTB/POZ domain-containing protein At3g56230-like [Durio zibethinus]|uniref:BTB/POZ domain-containing protein At3g56230-like n=1 Tax=Durio zibethinus TaxID=66656 RepID=A0A6P5YVG8_DURZI|nr:BTB/POZ domain-containing protein At3g56230-like [Durio zibethinus]
MDCSICSSMPFILRPPRNTICGACYEGARNVITLMNKLENYHSKGTDKAGNIPGSSSPNSCKASSVFMFSCYFCWPQPLANLTKWITSMKDMEDDLNEKISFLSGLVVAFRDQIHTDIQLKPGNNGPSIPAHRALLAARSEIFRNMLDSDCCKAPSSDTITLPELNTEELESLLEFLYSGNLALDKLEKHVYSLFVAADKYEIPYLQDFCERYMLSSLTASNVLEILQISDVSSSKTLKETALNFIVRNMEDIVFSAKYEVFATKNPHLGVQITRAFLMDAKNKRTNGV